ncbi:hypothetical protein CANINC_005050 [Pichia inconspicua]|uniref:N-acetylglucosamine-induced protein 1 n=1 Tax=Pichia inconspicua TaxID=52247 RepID=A0A4T0WUD5_9ASCO|nr:hypothetical protein CANINC_005050 [[Candida] inconspicua]
MILKEPLQWETVKTLVERYELEKLGRSAEQLQKYNDFKKKMRENNIDLATHLFITTLKWLPPHADIHMTPEEAVKLIKPEDTRPFCNPHDVCITLNDFPYYIAGKTLHMLVWVKFPMDPDPNSPIGDIDNSMKDIIEQYVRATFVKHAGVNRDDLIWWKNYAAIQSIKTIPHVHVLVNLENDTDGTIERNLRSLLGSPGVMLDYNDPLEGKL